MGQERKTARVRSPAYPSIDLETAVQKAEKLHDYARTTPLLVSEVLPQLGYESGKSANGMKAIAAMKSFGLIIDSGKKDARKISISDDARRLLILDHESPERGEIIKRCALSPTMYRYMWEQFGGINALPKDSALRSHLVLDKKFNESAVPGFLRDYKTTLEFAGLDKPSDLDEDETPSHDDLGSVEVGDLIEWKLNGADQFPEPCTVVHVDGNWVFVAQHHSGIPMSQVSVVEKGKVGPHGTALNSPRNPAFTASTASQPLSVGVEQGEEIFMQSALSRNADNPVSFRLLVKGNLGVTELSKLIRLLEAQKAIFED